MVQIILSDEDDFKSEAHIWAKSGKYFGNEAKYDVIIILCTHSCLLAYSSLKIFRKSSKKILFDVFRFSPTY